MNDNLVPLKKLNPFGKFCCTIGNLPTSYMLSLSYEEQLWWFCDFLENTVIPAINNNASAVEKVQILLADLKSYVDNYLDNLDLQSDINNKLDQMAQDGTLANIINVNIFNELNEKINNSLQCDDILSINKNSFFQNITIETEYSHNSLIYITKINKNKVEKISVLPTNLDYLHPYTNMNSLLELSEINNNYDVFINAGLTGINIMDGIKHESPLTDGCYYIGFTNDNTMKFFDAINNDITYEFLVSQGIVNCCVGYSPIIVNGNPYDYTELTSLSNTNNLARIFKEYIVEQKHPRQLIGEDENYFYIFSIIGRFVDFAGMDYNQMIDYFLNKNLSNLFNLDGGGSVQENILNKMLYPSNDFYTEKGRKIPTAIAFKIKED